MMLFQPPQPTPYDLRFSVAGIPVTVHPLFWLIALLLGSTGDILLVPIWVGVIFVSILVHELGHHHDRMTTRSQRESCRGEAYAENYACQFQSAIVERYRREFGDI